MKPTKEPKEKKEFEFSFTKNELKDLLTSITLIRDGMPEKDLGLLSTRVRLNKLIEDFKRALDYSAQMKIK